MVRARIERIWNSLKTITVWARETMIPQIRNNPRLEILSDPFDCGYDGGGVLMEVIELQWNGVPGRSLRHRRRRACG